jgi:hypothetical protein
MRKSVHEVKVATRVRLNTNLMKAAFGCSSSLTRFRVTGGELSALLIAAP